MSTLCSNWHLLQHLDTYGKQKFTVNKKKQLQVIRICNKGLSMADTLDTHYETLQRAKEHAEQHQNTGIDFIRQLPTDIVTTTLIPMFMDEFVTSSLMSCPYLQVPNLWRDPIIQSFGGLHFEIQYHGDCALSPLVQLTRDMKSLNVDIQ
ncbi:predicted protein [Lichtheimia corymbifera JMRC:FSU:9682]|uniref:Uncharacterized protein n=1 Tax=Lichtheimia corymbifera JMRC:FSU:9682 TaxID=1263082 RepID=A0A068SGY3_9FUNG|nr:predicted protein [Lichtheimia corymbifera JMRC:FSU:9682]